jgi:2-hydroxychromene-2-carboxylate isomerase
MMPILLGGVFKATGNSSPMTVPAKASYIYIDMKRFAEKYGVSIAVNPHFPILTTTLMRGITALQMRKDEREQDFMDAMYQAIWGQALNMNDPLIVDQVLRTVGLRTEEFLFLANDQATKDQLRSTTMRAVERGVFGAPTFFVDEQMFWGQDRIEQVKAALNA